MIDLKNLVPDWSPDVQHLLWLDLGEDCVRHGVNLNNENSTVNLEVGGRVNQDSLDDENISMYISLNGGTSQSSQNSLMFKDHQFQCIISGHPHIMLIHATQTTSYRLLGIPHCSRQGITFRTHKQCAARCFFTLAKRGAVGKTASQMMVCGSLWVFTQLFLVFLVGWILDLGP